jgi:hypothetical protein
MIRSPLPKWETIFDRMASEHQDIGLARIIQELFGKATAELAADHSRKMRTLLKLKGLEAAPMGQNTKLIGTGMTGALVSTDVFAIQQSNT